jgi:hypothetical protein
MNAVQSAADGFARDASPWVQRLARFGYIAKGVVYMLVAVLAVQAAIGSSEATGSHGAMETLLGAPLGRVALALIAIGLFGYALWRIYGAAADPEHDGVGHRFYCAGVAIIHIMLGVYAARLAISGAAGDGGSGTTRWTETGLAQPLGAWIVGAVGLGILGWGIGQLVKAWRSKLDDQLELHRLPPDRHRLVLRISRFGIAARGVVFGIIGIHLIRAALRHTATEARDAGGALRALEQQPLGPWLLAIVALGLFSYGIYEFLRARYRVIHVGGVADRVGGIRLERT